MTTADPIPVFVNHYASGPSGITTYADHLAATLPELRRINLHALSADATAVPLCVNVPAERSHDPHHVADFLLDIVRGHADRRIAWMPNVGDIAWAAVWHALSHLSPAERDRVRVFGIVHGDQDSQYEAMRRYAPIIAGLAGVSRQCVTALDALTLPDMPPTLALHYPVHLPEERSEPNWHGPLRLVYAGRFEESQKRISRLPDLFRRLAEAGVPFAATVAGDGPARASLEQSLSELPDHVSRRARMPGPVARADMGRLLAEHDVLLLVSAFEGTPLVLLEAMAAGVCPVLMNLGGGLSELLADGDNACVVQQGAIDEMVARIRDLHDDRTKLDRIKGKARETLKNRANPAAHAAWLRARLRALWERPAPSPERVVEPDPLGARVDRVVQAVREVQPRSVAVWGAGVVGRQLVDRLLAAGVTPALMVDADPVRHGSYRGIAVTAPTGLRTEPAGIVCVGSVAFADEIAMTLQQQPSPPQVLVP